MKKIFLILISLASFIFASQNINESSAYLEITLKINKTNRVLAAGVYKKYKQPFLKEIMGAKSKRLLIRIEDVQVLHGFDNIKNAAAYLKTDIFNNDVVRELSPLLEAPPEIRIYSVF